MSVPNFITCQVLYCVNMHRKVYSNDKISVSELENLIGYWSNS